MIRAILAIGLTVALTVIGGGIGFALGLGLSIAIATMRDPTASQQRDALPVGFAILRLFKR